MMTPLHIVSQGLHEAATLALTQGMPELSAELDALSIRAATEAEDAVEQAEDGLDLESALRDGLRWSMMDRAPVSSHRPIASCATVVVWGLAVYGAIRLFL